MPRLKHHFTEFHLVSLQHHLEKRIGHTIRDISDIRLLVEAIQQSTGHSLSVSTLYRLFLHTERPHQPYRSTLDILSQFAGVGSWSDFITPSNLTNSFSKDSVQTRDLIQINLQYGHFHALRDYLDQFDATTPVKVRYDVGLSLYKGMMACKDPKEAFSQLCGSYTFRKSFFELYADPDFAISHYSYGLNLYLGGSKPDHSVDQLRDFLFVRCLQFRHQWITQAPTIGDTGKDLFARNLISDNTKTEIYFHWPTTRYQAYRLWYIECTLGAIAAEKYFTDMVNRIKDNWSTWNQEEREIVLHTWHDVIDHSRVLGPNHWEKLILLIASEKVQQIDISAQFSKNPNLSYWLRQQLTANR